MFPKSSSCKWIHITAKSLFHYTDIRIIRNLGIIHCVLFIILNKDKYIILLEIFQYLSYCEFLTFKIRSLQVFKQVKLPMLARHNA